MAKNSSKPLYKRLNELSKEQSIADIKQDFKILLKAKEDSNEFIEKNKENYFKNDEKYYKIINEIKSLD